MNDLTHLRKKLEAVEQILVALERERLALVHAIDRGLKRDYRQPSLFLVSRSLHRDETELHAAEAGDETHLE